MDMSMNVYVRRRTGRSCLSQCRSGHTPRLSSQDWLLGTVADGNRNEAALLIAATGTNAPASERSRTYGRA